MEINLSLKVTEKEAKDLYIKHESPLDDNEEGIGHNGIID